MEYQLLCYTRKPDEMLYYGPRLAYSMHIALREGDGKYIPLNHNSGVLFARATENADGSFHYKLILPDTTSMVSDDNMPVTHDNFAITQSAEVGADVQANLNGQSDAYTASDAAEIKWNN